MIQLAAKASRTRVSSAERKVMSNDSAIEVNETDIRPYPQESLLVEAVAEMAGSKLSVQRVICTSAGLAQFAAAAARAMPQAEVRCTYLDLYRAELAREYWRDRPANLRIDCAAELADQDSTDEAPDVVALPFSASGEAELTRELVQVGHERLRMGGKMYITTDNSADTWLGEQLGKLFRKLERRALPAGMLYVGTRTEPLKKIKNFACEFAFRDRGRLIRVVSRPGVFSHRSIDAGARRLLDAMEVEAGARVLDIGCGSGVVALAAAVRTERVTVHAVDSNARAIECTQRGAELNGLGNLTVELNAEGKYAGAGSYDLAVANPPYYAGFRIARRFLMAGREALREGGTMVVVTKRPDWYLENMSEWFEDVSAAERKGYYVFQGVRPSE
jgi:16S rRNA G1207 methylase RsmC